MPAAIIILSLFLNYTPTWVLNGIEKLKTEYDIITPLLTHWGRDKMARILQMTFSDAYSWVKMCIICLKVHLSLFLMRYKPALVRIMVWYQIR